jgi:CRP/FNR family cyclic AMP-dependent transcriptional regulator
MVATQALTRDEFQILAGLGLFATLDEAEVEEIAGSVRKRAYRRGEVIHHVDDVAGDVFLITKGKVKHRLTAFDGRQLTHSIQGPGDPFGLLSAIDRKRRAGDAVALTDCDVLVIDRDDIESFLKDHPEAHKYLLDFHVASVRQHLAQVHDLAFLSVPMRLAKVLLAHSQQSVDPLTGQHTIPAYLNQTELAFLVGSTRESVNQCLKAFDRHGWIGFDRRNIHILDADALLKATA